MICNSHMDGPSTDVPVHTVKPALKTTCIQRPHAYKDQILQVHRGILSILLNLHIKTTCL